MDATTTRSIVLLVNKAKADFPQLSFEKADHFYWSPMTKTVSYNPDSHDKASFLHELSHALLNHSNFRKDMELIKMERAAWEYARNRLAKAYRVQILLADIEESLDTYRDWVHARSTCPNCQATGLQTKRKEYTCIACSTRWQVNDARTTRLYRQVSKK